MTIESLHVHSLIWIDGANTYASYVYNQDFYLEYINNSSNLKGIKNNPIKMPKGYE